MSISTGEPAARTPVQVAVPPVLDVDAPLLAGPSSSGTPQAARVASVPEPHAQPRTARGRRLHPFGLVRLVWRIRWNLIRLGLAVFALWVLTEDTGARLARLQLAALPDFDYVSEIQHLRQAGRFGEAMMVADAGLAATSGQTQHRVLDEKQRVESERSSALRRFKDIGMGALTGSAGLSGEASLERLGGAVAADMFVVGDVRDLLIQAGKYIVDGEADPVIVALSSVGLATTLAPEIDWAPALLKIAKKAGTLSRGMQEFVVSAVKTKRVKELESLRSSVKVLAEHASPAGAIRLLRHTDEPADVARMAHFMERNATGSRGAFALHVAGSEGASLLKRAESLGPAAVRSADDALVRAARKGPAGLSWLRTTASRALLKPHPILGLAKGLWKGNVESLVRAAIDRAGALAWWLVPMLAAWVFIECVLLTRKPTLVPARRVRNTGTAGT